MARLFGNEISALGSLGLLAIRVSCGGAFILHGWGKINGPAGMTAWMGEAMPPAVQAAAAISEFAGGILLVLGFLTPLAALAIGCVMAGALATVHIKNGDPFVASGPGPSWELPAIYLAVALVLLLVGPGMISVDAMLFRRRPVAPPDRVVY